MHPIDKTERRSSLRALSDILDYGGSLDALMQHARLLQQLQDALAGCLPPAMKSSCRVANIKGDTIHVLCNHPSTGARIRQMGPSLVQAWRQAGFVCNALEVRIRPGLPDDKPSKPFQRAPLSRTTADLLQSLESEVHHDGLKAALRHLRRSSCEEG